MVSVKKVLATFGEFLKEHLEIIKDDLALGNIEDATLWLNELVRMREACALKVIVDMNPWGEHDVNVARHRKRVIESENALNQRKAIALDGAIKMGRALFQAKGFKV